MTTPNPVIPAIPPKRHPRAEWTTEQREAWEAGMADAAGIARGLGDGPVSLAIEARVERGPAR